MEIPYKGKSFIRGNPLEEAIPYKGTSHIQRNPLNISIPYKEKPLNGNPLQGDVLYTETSLLKGNPYKGNPLQREILDEGKSLIRGHPLYIEIPYTKGIPCKGKSLTRGGHPL